MSAFHHSVHKHSSHLLYRGIQNRQLVFGLRGGRQLEGTCDNMQTDTERSRPLWEMWPCHCEANPCWLTGKHVQLIVRQQTLVAVVCMHECRCVCFWSASGIDVFRPCDLASGLSKLPVLDQLISAWGCLPFVIVSELLCNFIVGGYLHAFLFPASLLTTSTKKAK